MDMTPNRPDARDGLQPRVIRIVSRAMVVFGSDNF